MVLSPKLSLKHPAGRRLSFLQVDCRTDLNPRRRQLHRPLPPGCLATAGSTRRACNSTTAAQRPSARCGRLDRYAFRCRDTVPAVADSSLNTTRPYKPDPLTQVAVTSPVTGGADLLFPLQFVRDNMVRHNNFWDIGGCFSTGAADQLPTFATASDRLNLRQVQNQLTWDLPRLRPLSSSLARRSETRTTRDQIWSQARTLLILYVVRPPSHALREASCVSSRFIPDPLRHRGGSPMTESRYSLLVAAGPDAASMPDAGSAPTWGKLKNLERDIRLYGTKLVSNGKMSRATAEGRAGLPQLKAVAVDDPGIK